MKLKKKLEKFKIVIPTAYLGSIEPKEPKFVTKFKIKGITVASDRTKGRETYTFHIY